MAHCDASVDHARFAAWQHYILLWRRATTKKRCAGHSALPKRGEFQSARVPAVVSISITNDTIKASRDLRKSKIVPTGKAPTELICRQNEQRAQSLTNFGAAAPSAPHRPRKEEHHRIQSGDVDMTDSRNHYGYRLIHIHGTGIYVATYRYSRTVKGREGGTNTTCPCQS